MVINSTTLPFCRCRYWREITIGGCGSKLRQTFPQRLVEISFLQNPFAMKYHVEVNFSVVMKAKGYKTRL